MSTNSRGPLVSILIITYDDSRFLELSLRSALRQTYKNIEILIYDDSLNDNEDIINKYMKNNKNIRYFKSKNPLGKYDIEGYKECFKLASGDYINFLNEHDIFYPRKIEKMMRYLEYNEVAMVTSHRNLMDRNGDILPPTKESEKLTTVDKIYEGKEFGRKMLIDGNFIGPISTPIFRKNSIEDFGVFNKQQYFYITDEATWLSIFLKGKIVYVGDTLSAVMLKEEYINVDESLKNKIQEERKRLLENGIKRGFVTKDDL